MQATTHIRHDAELPAFFLEPHGLTIPAEEFRDIIAVNRPAWQGHLGVASGSAGVHDGAEVLRLRGNGGGRGLAPHLQQLTPRVALGQAALLNLLHANGQDYHSAYSYMLSTLHADRLQDVAWKSATRSETKAGIIVALVGAGHQKISHTLQAMA
jgi:hypothetical protein